MTATLDPPPAATAGLRFEPATPADDAGLRALLRATPMPGAVRLVQTREPAFFAADAALGTRVDTLVARATPGGPPVAMLQRAEREVWLGGRRVSSAYLGGLRVHPEHRGRGIARAGWAAVAAWQTARPVDLTLCALTDESHAARRVFVERPGGAAAPARFVRLADVRTLALAVPRHSRSHSPPNVSSNLPVPLPSEGRASAASRGGLPSGACPRDLAPAVPFTLISTIIAITGRSDSPAVWDPSAVRQTVVAGYSGLLGRVRPLVSGALRVLGRPGLPPVGEALRTGFLIGLHGESPSALDAILDAALVRARALGLDWLLVGFDARDPRVPTAARRAHVPYRSALYEVVWPGTEPSAVTRPVHVELATL